MHLNFEILVFLFTGARPVWYNIIFFYFLSSNIVHRQIWGLVLSFSWYHLIRQHKPVQPRQRYLLIWDFLLFFHHPKHQLNIFNIFSHTQRTSRIKPDNEKRPATKYFSWILKKAQIFSAKRAVFGRFIYSCNLFVTYPAVRASNYSIENALPYLRRNALDKWRLKG